MGFNLKGAITGAITGGASGGWAGAAAGAGLGALSSDEASDAKAAYNRQLSDSIMLWNMQNAYNTPLQQRNRLIEAGYNPNLWYTQGNTGNSGTISQPTLSYSQGSNSSLSNMLSRLNVRNAKANTKSNELDAEYKELRLDYLRAQIAKLKTGRLGVKATNAFDPYKERRKADIIENANRRSYNESFWGRVPLIGGFLANEAYALDKELRERIAERDGKKAWEIEPKHYFGL